MAPEPSNRRKYPRIRVPKGVWVGWKSVGQTSVSRAENMGLGGIFLHAPTPPSKGSIVEVLFDLPGGEVRARGIVRNSTPGSGMGVQFVQMRQDDRAKLHRYLAAQEALQKAAPASISLPAVPRAANPQIAKSSPANPPPINAQLVISSRREEAAQLRFEREFRQLMELTGTGTYYQLLGVTSESNPAQVKQGYYSLARKFHPDNHSEIGWLIAPLKNLMIIITEAYKTLASEEKRAAYDKSLAAMGGLSMHRGSRNQDSVEGWLRRANQCLRARNFVGSVVWLRKCVEAAPERASFHAMLGRSLATIPPYHHEAIEHFQKAINLDPWREVVYVQYGALLEEMHLPSRARAVYLKLLEVSPGHAGASERLLVLEAAEKSEKVSTRSFHLFSKKS